MSRALPVCNRHICTSQVYTWLILGFICYALPWSVFAADSTTLMRIQGSNTIGAKLGPALIGGLYEHDWFMVATDFDAYAAAQREIDALWSEPTAWWRKAILNTARMGWFSSDRTIRQYAQDIWGISL